MAYDAYMKAKDVEGEATAKGMEGQVEVLSFSFGASNPSTVGPGTGGIAAGRVSVSSFNIMKRTDKASPVLFQSCCKGKHIGEIIVTLRKASGDSGQAPFLKYTFTDCMVDSIQWSGSSGGDDTPTESVSFAYSKVEIEYFMQDDKGALKTAGQASWDRAAVKS